MNFALLAALTVAGALLNRLRGGLFSTIARAIGWEWGGKQRTQTMRAIWAVPTGLLLWWLTGQKDWFWAAFIASSFAGYAALGHGAHMVYSLEMIRSLWRDKPNDPQTELTTRWLPLVFGSAPGPSWADEKIYLYHLIGMGFIGFLRSAIMLSPIWWTEATLFGSIALVLSGSLLGLLYWLGYRIQGGETSELLAGGFYYSTFYIVLGTQWH